MQETLLKLFTRDLEKLKTEVSSYKDENDLWIITGGINNSAGNLCLHICGNLQHFIGAVLGNSGYIRKRDEEFSRKNVSVKELISEIDTTIYILQSTLKNLDKKSLDETYPLNVFGYEMTTTYFLTHLTTHLSYHLGQINYHRRLLAD